MEEIFHMCKLCTTDAGAHKSQIKPQPFPADEVSADQAPPEAPVSLGGLPLPACAVHKVVSSYEGPPGQEVFSRSTFIDSRLRLRELHVCIHGTAAPLLRPAERSTPPCL